MKGREEMHRNESGTAVVYYDMWDMGNKYKVYTIRDGIKKYYMAFDNIVSAVKYCNMIP